MLDYLQKKKGNPWSDSESEDDAMSFNEMTDSDEDMTPIEPRERTNRRGGKTEIFDEGDI